MIKKLFNSKFIIITTLISILVNICSCRMPDNFGFFQPITMDMRVPDGPPEFKAGWYAGCKSALANRSFANSFVYQEKTGPHYGSGVYQHDSVFQYAWRSAFFSCAGHIATFTTFNSMQHSPLSK